MKKAALWGGHVCANGGDLELPDNKILRRGGRRKHPIASLEHLIASLEGSSPKEAKSSTACQWVCVHVWVWSKRRISL